MRLYFPHYNSQAREPCHSSPDARIFRTIPQSTKGTERKKCKVAPVKRYYGHIFFVQNVPPIMIDQSRQTNTWMYPWWWDYGSTDYRCLQLVLGPHVHNCQGMPVYCLHYTASNLTSQVIELRVKLSTQFDLICSWHLAPTWAYCHNVLDP